VLRSREISEGWRVCARSWLEPPGYLGFGKLDWIQARVPGHIHHDLTSASVIGDPFFGLQEIGCQWVDDEVWIYEVAFEFQPQPELPNRVLRFEGLDTVCIMHLNGAEIARHDNMFLPLEVAVSELLRTGHNVLRVTFFPAAPEASKRKAHYFAEHSLRPDLVRFEASAFIRKAPYMFGWDWGPRLVSAGIWKPVRLLEFSSRIQTVDVRQCHRDGTVKLSCVTRVEGEGRVLHALRCPGKDPIMFEDAVEIEVADPKLWWPRGLGESHLYELTTYLLPASKATERHLEEEELALAHDRSCVRLGLRRVDLRREPDQHGESFQLDINGVPLFCLGANWIPDHSYPSQVTRARLEQQLDRVAAMNMNLLRVWGGGVYESDDFYELCDERGLLVWQDFPFACSYAPDDPAAIAVIENEARFQILRLAHHASLVIWCGNNENRMMFEAKWDDPSRHPMRCIGERIWDEALPNLLAILDPSRPYLPTSPHSPGGTLQANADASGDQHNWDVWHGRGDWIHYTESRARFASEYGFASAPTHAAWNQMYSPGWEALPVDDTCARWHDKTKKGLSTFRQLVELHYAVASNLEEWTYNSQLNQRDALKTAVEHYRRSACCAGSLIWQLNDCWPVQSWSVLDFTGSRKPAAYELERLYAPLVASTEVVRGPDAKTVRVLVYVSLHNSRGPRDATVEVLLRDVRDGTIHAHEHRSVRLASGDVLRLIDLDVSQLQCTATVAWVLCNGVVSHQLLCEPKDLRAPAPQFSVRRDRQTLHIGSRTPAIDVVVRVTKGGGRVLRSLLQFPVAGTQVIEVEGNCDVVALRTLGGSVDVPVVG
jgi:beta-mannosidase